MKKYENLDRIIKNIVEEYNGFSGEVQLMLVTNSFLRKTHGKYHSEDIKLHINKLEELCGRNS